MEKKRNHIEYLGVLQDLTQKHNFLTNEIRPSPTGVAGAEPVPSRKKKSSWVETDLDEMRCTKAEDGSRPVVEEKHQVYINTIGQNEYEKFDQVGVHKYSD